MQDIFALFGRLAGTMINPLVWGVSLAVSLVLRHRSFALRLAVVVAVVLVLGAALYAIDPDLGRAERVRGLIFGVVAAVIWLAIFTGIARLRR